MSEPKLKSGITTGSCAAAAAKAALLAWRGEFPLVVQITTPQGNVLSVEISTAQATAGGGRASVIKDAGDDPDITHGVEIVA